MNTLNSGLPAGAACADNEPSSLEATTGVVVLHPQAISILARHLSCHASVPERSRRRELLGAILERKAAAGSFDLELLHHWLDVALTHRDDRRLFGLDQVIDAARPRATRGSARVSRPIAPEACNMKSIPAQPCVQARAR